ncbi:MAG: glycerol-3-phosphate dehydrogenase [Pyrinomonadaceae bacterium]
MTISPSNTSGEFDVIIIGAGINGAGIARDAALRGLRVLLLDQGDVGSGTTSWSSRLIHGGLRYLEHRELGLVRESLRERERLLRNAPHLVRPLALLIPIYHGARRGRKLIRAGMVTYDLMSYDKSLPRHRMLAPAETLEQAPGLEREGLLGAAVYYDAQVEYAERLVLENVLDAQGFNATVRTYARVDRLLVEGGAVRGVEYTDLRSGHTAMTQAPVVLNVAGPWVDHVLRHTDLSQERLIDGTKGSHLIVDPFPGAPAYALYTEARSDGRPFFILPWNGLYLIGTTDTKFEGDLNELQAVAPEIEYLLGETNRVLPSAHLNNSSVRYSYAGVRPLPFEDSEAPSALTRRHFIRDHGGEFEGLISIIGGKLTTFRELAQQTVDLVYRKLGRHDPGTSTDLQSLPGANIHDFAHFSAEFHHEHAEYPVKTRQHLLRVYGTRAIQVVRSAGGDPDLLAELDPYTGAIRTEVAFAFQHEFAHTLSDVLLRRTMIGLNRDAGLNVVEEAARVAVEYLGWTNERALAEVAAYRAYVARFHPKSRC